LKNPEPIVLTRVLPVSVNQYYTGVNNRVVKRINGMEIKSLREVIQAFTTNNKPFHVIEFDGDHPPTVLDAKKVAEVNAGILEKYGIARERYIKDVSGGK
jgi:hypothetical protein